MSNSTALAENLCALLVLACHIMALRPLFPVRDGTKSDNVFGICKIMQGTAVNLVVIFIS